MSAQMRGFNLAFSFRVIVPGVVFLPLEWWPGGQAGIECVYKWGPSLILRLSARQISPDPGTALLMMRPPTSPPHLLYNANASYEVIPNLSSFDWLTPCENK